MTNPYIPDTEKFKRVYELIQPMPDLNSKGGTSIMAFIRPYNSVDSVMEAMANRKENVPDILSRMSLQLPDCSHELIRGVHKGKTDSQAARKHTSTVGLSTLEVHHRGRSFEQLADGSGPSSCPRDC